MSENSAVSRVIGLGAAMLLTVGGALALATPASAAASTRYVATTGSDSENDCTNQGQPCATVQHAVDQAVNGDTVTIGAGTFTGSTAVASKSLTITGSTTGSTTLVGVNNPAIYFGDLDEDPDAPTPTDILTHVTATSSTGGVTIGIGVGIAGATVSISNSTITDNAGGGIVVFGGTVDISNTVVDHNVGVGIAVLGGTLNVSDSSVSDNLPATVDEQDETYFGVGILGLQSAVSVVGSSVDGNGFAGIVAESFSEITETLVAEPATLGLSVLRSSVSNNALVGIGTLGIGNTIDNSTVDGNGAAGVYVLGGTTAVTSSTIAGTHPAEFFDTEFDTELVGSAGVVVLAMPDFMTPMSRAQIQTNRPNQLSGNFGLGAKPDWATGSAGTHTDSASEQRIGLAATPQDDPPSSDTILTLSGTIVASNSSLPDCTGPVQDSGYNLSSDAANSCGFESAQHSLSKTDPKLGALADNGGSTLTMLPSAGSAALEAIPAGAAGCVSGATDQRGVARPQGDRCDIGAVEVAVAPIVISPASLPGGTVGQAYRLQFTATGGADSEYVWSLAPGSTLPSGLSLSSGGLLSGTPKVSGLFSFTVSVNDPVLKKYSLAIAAAPAAPAGSGVPLANTGSQTQQQLTWGGVLLAFGLLALLGGTVRRGNRRTH